MAGYSGTPLFQKLGIKPESRVAILHCPISEDEIQWEAPFSFEPEKTLDGLYDVVVAFHTKRFELESELDRLCHAIKPTGGLWIAWPKKASGLPTDVTEDVLREVFLPTTGFVDNKVCAIDATWSGLRFVLRREFR